jgi:selenocysteine lyase/cysteine desulfurase
MPSVSGALAAVSGALQATDDRRKKIVITSLDFPTLGHHYFSRERLGYEVVVVESHDGVTVPLEQIRAAVDEDTLMLATSHVFFTSGTIQDARYLAEIAHDAGSYILLDAYQSNGQVPIDVLDLGVDFLTSGGLKWLCGGPGAAYLYVDRNVDILPTTLSWFGVEDQFGFDLRATPRTDARRFELGTPAVGCAYTAAGGLSIVLEAGVDRIAKRSRMLSRDLRERLADAGHQLHQADGPGVRSALVLMEHVAAQEAVRWMAEHDVVVDARGNLLRFSPHFYNTIDDNVRAVEVLGDMPGAR